MKPKLPPKKVLNIAPVPAKKMTIAINVKLTFNCCNPNEIVKFNVKLTFIVSYNINVHIAMFAVILLCFQTKVSLLEAEKGRS